MSLYTFVMVFTLLNNQSEVIKIGNLSKDSCQQLVTHYKNVRHLYTYDTICIRQESK